MKNNGPPGLHQGTILPKKSLILKKEMPRPMTKSMNKPYLTMNDDQEFIDALFSALEERDWQIQLLLGLLKEKHSLEQYPAARVDEAC